MALSWSVAAGPAAAAPSARTSVQGQTLAAYRQIVLNGHTLKWGTPALGTGAVLTYAIVDRERSFAHARNCPAIDAPDGLLAVNGISPDLFDHEVEAAFAAWSAVADVRFRKVGAPDADILIGAEVAPSGRAFTNVEYADAGAAGLTSLTRSVICLSPAAPWKVGFDGNLAVYDIRYALTHEIGHAIGLDHPGRTGELMDFRYGEAFRVPQLGDIAGATFLYGPSPVETASRPGLVRKINAAAPQR